MEPPLAACHERGCMSRAWLHVTLSLLPQVIGLKGGLHTAGVLAQISPHWHGERLGQAYELDMTLHAAEGEQLLPSRQLGMMPLAHEGDALPCWLLRVKG